MKKKFLFIWIVALLVIVVTSCNQNTSNGTSIDSTISDSNEEYEMNRLKIEINGKELFASLVDNSATKSLKEILKNEPLEIKMNDYGGFEKVGSLGFSLPTTDTYIKTTVGDIMLYQGNSMVIFYDSNSWEYIRIGKIEGVNKEQLIEIFGKGSVTITLSLVK